MRRHRHAPHTVVIFMAAVLASTAAGADTIPPNPFESRLESPGPQQPARDDDPAAAGESAAADNTDTGLEVVGVVSGGGVSILTLRRGADRLFSVAVGEQIDDTLTLVEISDRRASFRRSEDDTLIYLELPGGEDD